MCGEERINRLRVMITEKVLGNKNLLSMIKQKSVVSSLVKPQAQIVVAKPQRVDDEIKTLPQQDVLARSEPVSSPFVSQKLEVAKTPAMPPMEPAPIKEQLPPSKPLPK